MAMGDKNSDVVVPNLFDISAPTKNIKRNKVIADRLKTKLLNQQQDLHILQKLFPDEIFSRSPVARLYTSDRYTVYAPGYKQEHKERAQIRFTLQIYSAWKKLAENKVGYILIGDRKYNKIYLVPAIVFESIVIKYKLFRKDGTNSQFLLFDDGYLFTRITKMKNRESDRVRVKTFRQYAI